MEPAACYRAHSQLCTGGQAHLADQKDIQREPLRPCDRCSNGNATPGQRKDQVHVQRATLHLLRKTFPGVRAIAKDIHTSTMALWIDLFVRLLTVASRSRLLPSGTDLQPSFPPCRHLERLISRRDAFREPRSGTADFAYRVATYPCEGVARSLWHFRESPGCRLCLMGAGRD